MGNTCCSYNPKDQNNIAVGIQAQVRMTATNVQLVESEEKKAII